MEETYICLTSLLVFRQLMLFLEEILLKISHADISKN